MTGVWALKINNNNSGFISPGHSVGFRASILGYRTEILALLILTGVLPLPSVWAAFHPEGSCCESEGRFAMTNSDFPPIRVFCSEQSNKWEFQLFVHVKHGKSRLFAPRPATWKRQLHEWQTGRLHSKFLAKLGNIYVKYLKYIWKKNKHGIRESNSEWIT